jgi:hypothetical protein
MSAPPTISATQSEQTRLLAEHKESLNVSAALMRRAIDARDIRAVLAQALTMLEELRTGSLTPKARAAPFSHARAAFRAPRQAARLLTKTLLSLPRRCTTSSSSRRSTN